MQHTKEKVRGDMGEDGVSLYPRAGDRVTGIAPATPVNIALVKVFARVGSLHPGSPRGSVERFLPCRLHVRAAAAPFPPKPFTFASYAAQRLSGRSPSSVYTWPEICLPY